MARIDYIIGLGSNLGERLSHLRAARAGIDALPTTSVQACSAVYESDPVGPPQPDYLNAALRVHSGLSPGALLEHLQAIERARGRVRRDRWGPRTLDLDILWASEPVETDGLRVPHPELTARWFALRPLLDVAPELGGTYGGALDALGPHPSPLPDCL